jgi:hypothetical protein
LFVKKLYRCLYHPIKRIAHFGRVRSVLFLLLILFFFLSAPTSQAQERRFDVGLGLEATMNSDYNAAASSWLSFLLGLGNAWAVGAKAGYSNDFSGIATVEIAALGRWYFLPLAQSQLFAQLELGTSLILYEEKIRPVFLGGLGAGWRFTFGQWHLEPALRLGYPYIWGGSLSFGYRR